MAQTRKEPTRNEKHRAAPRRNASLLDKLRAQGYSDISPKEVRCIIAECQYRDEFELDDHAKMAIAASVKAGYKSLLFIAVKDDSDFDSWKVANYDFLKQYEGQIEIENNINYYESETYQAVSRAMDAFYETHESLKIDFESKVLDEAKTYVARKLMREEKEKDRANKGLVESVRPPTHPEVAANKNTYWEKASADLKEHSLLHVCREAKAVVSWGTGSESVTAVVSQHFTSAMRVAVTHAEQHASEMKISFRKQSLYLDEVTKRKDLPSRFDDQVEGESILVPEARELAMLYIATLPPHTAAQFIVSINDLLTKKRSPTNSLSTSPESEREGSLHHHYRPQSSPRGSYVPQGMWGRPPVTVNPPVSSDSPTTPALRMAANE